MAATAWESRAPSAAGKRPTYTRTFAVAIILCVVAIPVHRIAAWTASGKPQNALATIFLVPGPDDGLHPAPPHWYPALPPAERVLTLTGYLRGNPDNLPFIEKTRIDPFPTE